jgi:hypothetical protein
MSKHSHRRRSGKVTRKPSGTAGPFKVTRTAEGAIGHHIKIDWPQDQKDIERRIFGYFRREFEKTGAKFLKIKDGGTKEIDFLLTLPGGQSYLELMEAVVPFAGEIPHQPGSQGHWPIEYADRVFSEVQKKIDKYGFKHKLPLDLLIYTTHEQYRPNEAAIQVLRHYFKDRRHPFHYVFFITPLSEDLSPMWVLFNRDYPREPPPLDDLRGRYWINLPSVGFELKVGQIAENPPGGEPMIIKSFPRGRVSEDGTTLSIDAELQDGSVRTMALPYDQLDWLVQALMSMGNAAFDRQAETGRLGNVNPLDAAIIAEGCRVLPNPSEQDALVQVTGRKRPDGPLGLGSFKVNQQLAEALGKRLLAVAEDLATKKPT